MPDGVLGEAEPITCQNRVVVNLMFDGHGHCRWLIICIGFIKDII